MHIFSLCALGSSSCFHPLSNLSIKEEKKTTKPVNICHSLSACFSGDWCTPLTQCFCLCTPVASCLVVSLGCRPLCERACMDFVISLPAYVCQFASLQIQQLHPTSSRLPEAMDQLVAPQYFVSKVSLLFCR